MGTVFNEGRHPGEVVLREANGSRSRDAITIPAGTGVVAAGTVVGEITASPGEYAPSPVAETAGIEGAEVAKAVTLYEADATTDAVKVAALTRDAELNGSCLEFEASVDTDPEKDAKTDQLKAVGLIVR